MRNRLLSRAGWWAVGFGILLVTFAVISVVLDEMNWQDMLLR